MANRENRVMVQTTTREKDNAQPPVPVRATFQAVCARLKIAQPNVSAGPPSSGGVTETKAVF